MKKTLLLLAALLALCAGAIAEEQTCPHDGGFLSADARTHLCELCGASLPHEIERRAVAATCSSVGYTMDVCIRCAWQGAQCDVQPISPNAHQYGDWTITAEATCSAEGHRQRSCALCGATQGETLAKAEHSMAGVVYPPTCLADGYTLEVCSVCGATGARTDAVSHSAAYHAWGPFCVTAEPTCEGAGEQERVCAECGAKHRQQIPALGHSLRSVTVEAACLSDGYTADICAVCGRQIGERRDAVPGEHDWGEWTTTAEPTCEREGERKRLCSACGQTQIEAVAPTGHTPKEGQRKPTCETDGYTVTACRVCGKELGERRDAVPASEDWHVWDKWEELSPATCESRGEWLCFCSVCGARREVTSPELEHVTEERVVAATFAADGYTAAFCTLCGREVGARREVTPAGMYACAMRAADPADAPVSGAASAELRVAAAEDGSFASLLVLSADEGGHVAFDAADAWFAQNGVAYVELSASGLTVRMAASGLVDVRVGGADSGEGYELLSVLTNLSNAGFDESVGEYDREGAYCARNGDGQPLTLYGRDLVITMPDRPCLALVVTVD